MIWLKVTGNAHEGVCLDWLLQTKVILARGPSGSRADPESPAFIECGCRNLRSSVSPPSSVIWQHFPLPLLNHLWYCCYFLRFPLQIVGFTRLGIILFSFLAPRVLAHTRCTLKIYWWMKWGRGDRIEDWSEKSLEKIEKAWKNASCNKSNPWGRRTSNLWRKKFGKRCWVVEKVEMSAVSCFVSKGET